VSLLRHHVVLMFFYATATALFFALLWKQERRDRISFFVRIFLAMFVGGLVLGWLMYPFPLR
jgi:cytochrome bd-type quinol oxidase subunit 2